MILKSKAGISTTEFIICIPILIAFFFIIPFLSDMLDAQQDLVIASRNHAQESTPSKSVFSGSNKIEVSESEITKRVEFTEQEKGNETSLYHNLSGMIGEATSKSLYIVNILKNVGLSKSKLFTGSELELYSVTMHPTELKAKYQSFLFNSLSWLGKLNPWQDNKEDFSNAIFRSQLRSTYVRRDGGFHPSDYQYQAFLGFFLAEKADTKTWYTPDTRKAGLQSKTNSSFVNQCTMHFMANDKCERKGNWFAYTTRTILSARAIVALISSFFSGGTSEVAANVQKEVTKQMTQEAIKASKEALVTYISSYAAKEIQDALNTEQLYSNLKIDNLQNSFTDKLNGEETKLGQNLGGVIGL